MRAPRPGPHHGACGTRLGRAGAGLQGGLGAWWDPLVGQAVWAVCARGHPRTVRSPACTQVDDWAKFSAPPHVGVLIKELRQELELLLAAKVAQPGLELSQDRAVGVVMQLLSGDGF